MVGNTLAAPYLTLTALCLTHAALYFKPTALWLTLAVVCLTLTRYFAEAITEMVWNTVEEDRVMQVFFLAPVEPPKQPQLQGFRFAAAVAADGAAAPGGAAAFHFGQPAHGDGEDVGDDNDVDEAAAALAEYDMEREAELAEAEHELAAELAEGEEEDNADLADAQGDADAEIEAELAEGEHEEAAALAKDNLEVVD
jgi:hypothetical protein